jgi:hypothetical protein
MLICIYIYSYNAIRLWYKLCSEPILAYAFPSPLAFATARERGVEPTISLKIVISVVRFALGFSGRLIGEGVGTRASLLS